MKFIVRKGSETFDKLSELQKRMREVNLQAETLSKEIGAQSYATYNRELAGGIDGFYFDEKPEGWKRLADRIYFPKSTKANNELIERINALPRLKNKELNEIVGYELKVIDFKYMRRPGIVFGDDFHLLDFSETSEYTPPPDIEEITVSEYKRLLAEIDCSKEKSGE